MIPQRSAEPGDDLVDGEVHGALLRRPSFRRKPESSFGRQKLDPGLAGVRRIGLRQLPGPGRVRTGARAGDGGGAGGEGEGFRELRLADRGELLLVEELRLAECREEARHEGVPCPDRIRDFHLGGRAAHGKGAGEGFEPLSTPSDDDELGADASATSARRPSHRPCPSSRPRPRPRPSPRRPWRSCG
jgi:hypothetical protein